MLVLVMWENLKISCGYLRQHKHTSIRTSWHNCIDKQNNSLRCELLLDTDLLIKQHNSLRHALLDTILLAKQITQFISIQTSWYVWLAKQHNSLRREILDTVVPVNDTWHITRSSSDSHQVMFPIVVISWYRYQWINAGISQVLSPDMNTTMDNEHSENYCYYTSMGEVYGPPWTPLDPDLWSWWIPLDPDLWSWNPLDPDLWF
jgi:hypothetical protein